MEAFSGQVLLQRTALAASLSNAALQIKARSGVRRHSYDSAAFSAAGVPVDAAAVPDALLGPAIEVPPAKALKFATSVLSDVAKPATSSPRDCRASATGNPLRQPLRDQTKASAITATAAQLPLARHDRGAAAACAAARHVHFARGQVQGTPDGHPAHEGEVARPVRCLPLLYPNDLTKGNVLMLEQLLREDCSDCSASVARLKRRVGLTSVDRAPRPFAQAASAPLLRAAVAAGGVAGPTVA